MNAVGGMVDDLVRSAARLTDTCATLTDDDLRAPSLLPGWTRAHVLAHIAGSAEAYVRLLTWARTDTAPGRVSPPLDGEVGSSLDRLTEAARQMPTGAWGNMVTALAGWHHPAWYTLRRGLRELETHHLDLNLGYRTSDWPPAYVAWALDDTLATLAARGFAVGTVTATDLARSWELPPDGPRVEAAGHVLLGWLSGRTPADGLVCDVPLEVLPVPPAWPQPPTPGWGRAEQDTG
ncbi:MAG TPA: maleylpyruvate isomerase family mycothiol-dependent enzyme [Candidatus Limnocylindrales bacterium]